MRIITLKAIQSKLSVYLCAMKELDLVSESVSDVVGDSSSSFSIDSLVVSGLSGLNIDSHLLLNNLPMDTNIVYVADTATLTLYPITS